MIFSIGHSNHSIEQFIELNLHHKIDTLVDVRAYPNSKRYPWFERDRLQAALSKYAIRYHFAGRELGGRRKTLVDSANVALAATFRGYADHMVSAEFRAAIQHLTKLSTGHRLVIMCAERQPAACHRCLIAGYLYVCQQPVYHITDRAEAVCHKPHVSLRVDAEQLIYDTGSQQSLL
jgi:uncharacterized protein (DUF488 family)